MQQQSTMFCHDGTTIYYPTGPGRVHMIMIAALADCDGSDEDLSDSTSVGDVSDLAMATQLSVESNGAPGAWPPVFIEDDLGMGEYPDFEATAADFHDCLEQWADWCDRDAARLDSFDGPAPDEDAAGILARLRSLVADAREAVDLGKVVEAIGGQQPAVAV